MKTAFKSHTLFNIRFCHPGLSLEETVKLVKDRLELRSGAPIRPERGRVDTRGVAVSAEARQGGGAAEHSGGIQTFPAVLTGSRYPKRLLGVPAVPCGPSHGTVSRRERGRRDGASAG